MASWIDTGSMFHKHGPITLLKSMLCRMDKVLRYCVIVIWSYRCVLFRVVSDSDQSGCLDRRWPGDRVVARLALPSHVGGCPPRADQQGLELQRSGEEANDQNLKYKFKLPSYTKTADRLFKRFWRNCSWVRSWVLRITQLRCKFDHNNPTSEHLHSRKRLLVVIPLQARSNTDRKLRTWQWISKLLLLFIF